MMNCTDIAKFKGDLTLYIDDATRLLSEAEEELEGLKDDVEACEDDIDKAEAQKEVDAWLEENQQDLDELRRFIDDGPSDGYCVHECHLERYIRNELEDIDDLSSIPSYVVINWGETLNNLKQDYCGVDYGDITYYYRG